jgi:hemerythrin superfamily protein
MEHINRRSALKALACTAAAAALSDSVTAAAEPEAKTERGKTMEIKIPASLKAEHDELHEDLVRLTRSGGKTAEAAQAVAKVLHPHFVKEEELAMPPLGLLQALVEGPVRPEMAKVVELTDKLKQEMPAMLKEHEAIVGTLQTLARAGKQENKPQAEQFAEMLTQHAKTEEEILYPTAILVGEYIKLRLNK